MSNDLSEIDMLLDKDALALAERRALWAKHRAEILPLVRAFVKINATLRFPDSLDVSLSGDKHTLAEAVRALRTNGFRTLNKPPEKGSSTWSAFYDREGCGISVWLSFSSSVCRRVKVGTRTVEQDIYETVCDDEIVLPEVAA